MSEMFKLKWNDFHSNVSKSFGILRDEEYLHDVTLVGDDYTQISAHKLILSACSEYFKNIFKNYKKHSLQYPVVCLEGVNSEDIKNILDYIYNGEVQLNQDKLDRFLSIAQRLKLDGVLGDDKEENNDMKHNIVTKETEAFKVPIVKTESNNLPDLEEIIPVKSEELGNIDEKLIEYITRDEAKNYICSFCGKTSKKISHMKNHIEIHMEGLSFSCQFCDKTFRSRNALGLHRRRYHK